ncbi:hypothetical protein Tco_1458407 [Tanacetum coccineum]
MEGSFKSLVELEYSLEEATRQPLNNIPGEPYLKVQNPHDLRKPLPLIPNSQGLRVIHFDHFINNDLEYLSGGVSSQKYATSGNNDKAQNLGTFSNRQKNGLRRLLTVVHQRLEDLTRVESYQKKLNLTKLDTYRLDLKRREAYTAYSNPRGFIYQNKDKKNRLMRIDELHKFSDGTLNDVRTALNDHLKGIRIEYLPQTIWRQSDKDKAGAMIQAIDK